MMNIRFWHILLSSLLLGFLGLTFAATDDASEEHQISASAPPNIGNFALPGPQQPGPLLSFGQTLIGRNHLQLYFDTFSPYHISAPLNNLNASLVYGITDATSLYFNYPIEADPNTRGARISALRDITLQLEHAIYTHGNARYQEQATLVGAITAPTDEATVRHSARSFGAPTYFFGSTFNRTYVDWQFFCSPGVLLTASSNHVRLGSQGLYQAGIGHLILSVRDQSILFGLLELNGQYTAKDQVLQFRLPNTGGNIITLTPSLSLASQNFIAQVGVGFPIVQNLNGNQKKMDYLIASQFILTIS